MQWYKYNRYIFVSDNSQLVCLPVVHCGHVLRQVESLLDDVARVVRELHLLVGAGGFEVGHVIGGAREAADHANVFRVGRVHLLELGQTMAPMATAGVLTVLVNIGFLVAGAMLMLFSSSLESSGWVTRSRALTSSPPPAQPRRSFASWAIVLAVVGIVGAIVQATWTPPR
ncbi:hypothetical protein PF006_g20605 [Phytophthora fragariae]|uniref:Uncharacterized protein n=3 Tax=Phytophthora fragariae TaxID=53985 RepID=A0A6A3S4I0_9STRA|nr:hypothetical protein PF006_g20605 [Phytophthora fragariae]